MEQMGQVPRRFRQFGERVALQVQVVQHGQVRERGRQSGELVVVEVQGGEFA
jgi:hypothetical protein